MQVKVTPATPLPWDGLFNATAYGLGATVREQNAAYATHAANAYPRLVATLREAMSQVKSAEACRSIQDLLVSIGEIK